MGWPFRGVCAWERSVLLQQQGELVAGIVCHIEVRVSFGEWLSGVRTCQTASMGSTCSSSHFDPLAKLPPYTRHGQGSSCRRYELHPRVCENQFFRGSKHLVGNPKWLAQVCREQCWQVGSVLLKLRISLLAAQRSMGCRTSFLLGSCR
eukprot:1063574-Amphidinium_carterae.1